MLSFAAILRDAPSALLRMRRALVATPCTLILRSDAKHRVAKDAVRIKEKSQ